MLATNKEKDAFGADYRVVNRAYNISVAPIPSWMTIALIINGFSGFTNPSNRLLHVGPLIWLLLVQRHLNLFMRILMLPE
jgi:hypothetical protein